MQKFLLNLKIQCILGGHMMRSAGHRPTQKSAQVSSLPTQKIFSEHPLLKKKFEKIDPPQKGPFFFGGGVEFSCTYNPKVTRAERRKQMH